MAKTNIIENLFSYLAISSAFLPILIFVFHWHKCSPSRQLWIIVLYAFFVDFLLSYAVDFFPHKTVKITLYASYTFFEYIAFGYFLFLHIKNKKFKRTLLVVSGVFLFFLTIYDLTVKFRRIDSIPIGIEAILLILFSCYYLYEELLDSTTLFIYLKPTFWIVFGIILYLAGNFFIYIYAESLSRVEGEKYWYITNIFSIIKNIFFCIAILLHTKPPRHTVNYSNFDLSSLN